MFRLSHLTKLIILSIRYLRCLWLQKQRNKFKKWVCSLVGNIVNFVKSFGPIESSNLKEIYCIWINWWGFDGGLTHYLLLMFDKINGAWWNNGIWWDNGTTEWIMVTIGIKKMCLKLSTGMQERNLNNESGNPPKNNVTFYNCNVKY